MSITLPAISFPYCHQLFEMAAIAVGVAFYRRQGWEGLLGKKQFPVMAGAFLGAGIGNKLLFWLERADLWASVAATPLAWFSGQSMVGGLVGGLIGVELAKWLTGQKQSTGDRFVYPILVGIAIGRMGCFLTGLTDGTSGNPSSLPWAVDFGDAVPRHPTQIYEMLFVGVLGWGLATVETRLAAVPGLRFKLMMSAYLAWRLVIDGIKPVHFDWGLGLSGIQMVCLIVLLVYMPLVRRDLKRLIPEQGHATF